MWKIYQLDSLVANAGVTQTFNIGDVGDNPTPGNLFATPDGQAPQPTQTPINKQDLLWVIVLGVIFYGLIFK